MIKLTTSLFAFYYHRKPGILKSVSELHPPCYSLSESPWTLSQGQQGPLKVSAGLCPICIAFTFLLCKVPNKFTIFAIFECAVQWY